MEQNIYTHIENLIQQNKIEEAIEVFKNWATAKNDSELTNSLIVLKLRYTRVRQQENMGVIRLNQALPEYAFISNSVLDFLKREKLQSIKESFNEDSDTSSKKTILFLASMPSGEAKLQLEKEFTKIYSNLQDKSDAYELRAEWAVKPSDLQKAILKYKPNIIHFSGHGIKETTTKESGLLLENKNGQPQFVTVSALENMFKILARKLSIQIVVLNACFTENQAQSIHNHVPFVIGMKQSVADDTAIEFSTGFYRGLADDANDIEFAFDLAVNAIQLEGLDDDDVPVLLK